MFYCHMYSFSSDEISMLRISISKFCSDYKRLFKENLKPKFHFLLHYADIILKSGPPRLYWCFLFETKHRETKKYAHATSCRKNPPLTFSKKYLMKFASFIMSDPIRNINVECVHESEVTQY